jgi:hypothetical protein
MQVLQSISALASVAKVTHAYSYTLLRGRSHLHLHKKELRYEAFTLTSDSKMGREIADVDVRAAVSDNVIWGYGCRTIGVIQCKRSFCERVFLRRPAYSRVLRRIRGRWVT